MGWLSAFLNEPDVQLFTEVQLIKPKQLQKAKVLLTFVYKLLFSCKVNLNEPSPKR